MSSQTESLAADHRYMARALQLAERGLYTTDPNPRVGCVLVRNGRIVGEGWHRRVGEAHAEIEALRFADGRTSGATAYVTLEPCCHHGKTPPCTEALVAAGVVRVVAAMEDPNPRVAGKGLAALRTAGIRTECGLLGEAAAALNPGFCRRMRGERGLVRSKLAMSLDGRTALANGESRWITGEAARLDVHRLRARSSAIVTGVDTVLADDPSLTARLDTDDEVLQPVRIVLDSHLRTPVTARVLAQPGRTVILTTSESGERICALSLAGAEVHVLAAREGSGRVDLRALAQYLALNEYNEVMVEAGATLNGALLQAGLVDEWVVYMAPCVLGSGARGILDFGPLHRIGDRPEMRISEVRHVGPDLRIRLQPSSSSKAE